MGEFRGITSPGRYRRRNGAIGTISCNDRKRLGHLYRWKDETGRSYRDEGQFYAGAEDYRDFVAGPLPDEAELAGLTGYVAVSTDGDATHGDFEIQPAMRAAIYGGGIIDLSTIRKDQLVQPEPKRETVMCRFWAYEGGTIICRRKDENSYPGGGTGKLLSHWEREITFTHGEGLS